MSARARHVLHVDMDAFFAAVEQRDQPALRGQPVVVGGGGDRGVVCAASYEARRYGIHSAMPMVRARQRCPGAVVVPPRHRHYRAVSAEIFAIFGRFTPLIEGLSLDEAFLDVTGSADLFGDGAAIARQIQAAIAAEVGLGASAGVATSKFVAKIASDLDKPRGLVVVPPGGEAAFLAPLPIGRMWGIGAAAEPRLRAAGVSTLGALAAAPAALAGRLLGSSSARMQRLAAGIDPRPVEPHRAAKSIGVEDTFPADLVGAEALMRPLLGQCLRLASRLGAAELSCGQVAVKLKDSRHRLVSRQAPLPAPSSDADALIAAVRGLLPRFDLEGAAWRLTGVVARELTCGVPAATLFAEPARERAIRIEATRRAIAGRFGEAALTRATLVDGGTPRRTDRP